MTNEAPVVTEDNSTPDVLLDQLQNSNVATEKVNLISVILERSAETETTEGTTA